MDAPGRHAVRNHRDPLRQRRRGGDQHVDDAEPVQPGHHHAELHRQIPVPSGSLPGRHRDEFQIYSRALTAAEVASLTTSAGGTAGGGDVAWYRFDEAKGATAVDSSGKSNDATIVPITSDWTPVLDGGGSMTASLDTSTPLNGQLTRSLELAVTSAGAGQRTGMANGGYFGVPVVPGQVYRVSFFARASEGFAGPVTVSLEAQDGSQTFASASVRGLTPAWKRFTTTLRVPRGATGSEGNRFVIGIDNRGGHVTPVPSGTSVWFQVISVFPPTYRDRPNGLRPDLMEILRRMRPKILRFPGGNYLEGDTIGTRWDWKQTIGPVWARPGHQNSAWGYFSDDGLGLLEFLQLAEDLGAAPVMAIWAGYTLNGTVVAQAGLAPYVQDALDQIEYATGPVTSAWGRGAPPTGTRNPSACPTWRSATRTSSMPPAATTPTATRCSTTRSRPPIPA